MEIMFQCCFKQQKYVDAEQTLLNIRVLGELTDAQKLAVNHHLAEVYYDSGQLDKAESACNLAIEGHQGSERNDSAFYLSVALMIAILDCQDYPEKRSMADAYRLLLPSGIFSPYQASISKQNPSRRQALGTTITRKEFNECIDSFPSRNDWPAPISLNSDAPTSPLSNTPDDKTLVGSMSTIEAASANATLLMPKNQLNRKALPPNYKKLIAPKQRSKSASTGEPATSDSIPTLRSLALLQVYSSTPCDELISFLSGAWFSTVMEINSLQIHYIRVDIFRSSINLEFPPLWVSTLEAKENKAKSLMENIRWCMLSSGPLFADAEIQLAWPNFVGPGVIRTMNAHKFDLPRYQHFLTYLLSEREDPSKHFELAIKLEAHAKKIQFEPRFNILGMYLSASEMQDKTYANATKLVQLGADISYIMEILMEITPQEATFYQRQALRSLCDCLADWKFDFNACDMRIVHRYRSYYHASLGAAVWQKKKYLVGLVIGTSGVNPSASAALAGYTALNEACQRGDVEIAKILLEAAGGSRYSSSDI